MIDECEDRVIGETGGDDGVTGPRIDALDRAVVGIEAIGMRRDERARVTAEG